jgi:hypothetical protein
MVTKWKHYEDENEDEYEHETYLRVGRLYLRRSQW